MTVVIIALLAIPLHNVAHATLIIADSNDLTLGGQNAQAGGTGFTGTWTATGTIDVIGGDLSAPVSTGYALTQSGTAQSIRGDHNAARQNHRALATALTGDTVWFSLLLQNQADTSRGGISFNGNTFSPSNPRIQSTGKTLFVNGSTASGDVFVAGQTALVLGRITVADVGNDTFEVWVNPDVSGGEAGLGIATGSNTGAYFGAGGINRIGNISYGHNSNAGAIVDMIYLSDGPNAFADVTGITAIPEPSTALLLGWGCLGLALMKRRRIRFAPYCSRKRKTHQGATVDQDWPWKSGRKISVLDSVPETPLVMIDQAEGSKVAVGSLL
jgi:hypothetical protein